MATVGERLTRLCTSLPEVEVETSDAPHLGFDVRLTGVRLVSGRVLQPSRVEPSGSIVQRGL